LFPTGTDTDTGTSSKLRDIEDATIAQSLNNHPIPTPMTTTASIAEQILKRAKTGERDPVRLRIGALMEVVPTSALPVDLDASAPMPA